MSLAGLSILVEWLQVRPGAYLKDDNYDLQIKRGWLKMPRLDGMGWMLNVIENELFN